MKTNLIILILFTLGSLYAGSPDKNPDISLEKALELSQSNDKNIFLSMNAEWCLPCHLLKAGPLATKEVQETISSHYVSVDVDIDDHQRKDWTDSYTISCLPNLLILNKEGDVLIEHSGAISKEELLDILNKYKRNNDVETVIADAPITTDAPIYDLIDETPILEKIVNDSPTVVTVSSAVDSPSTIMMNNVKVVRNTAKYTVTVGAFAVYKNVMNYKEKLEQEYAQEFFITTTSKNLYQLNIGKFGSRGSTKNLTDKLKANKIDNYIRKI